MQCPNCGNAIDADFGVVTCGRCQAVFSVGIDGQIEGGSSSQTIVGSMPSEEIELEEVLEQQISEEPAVEEIPVDLAQVTDFANADVSVAGPLSYVLVVEGLDNKDLYQEVHQVLAEPRLMIDAHSLMKTVRMGRLEVRGLNPVKASRIVSRLSEMPLKISWRQTVYDN